MRYRSRFLTEDQTQDLISDLESGLSNKEAEARYGISSISYVKSKIGLIVNRQIKVDWSELHSLYVEQKKTAKEIAFLFECSQCAVLKHLKSQGIPRRKKGPRKGTSV